MACFDLKSKILEGKLTKPTVFNKFPSITDWPFISVTVEILSKILKDRKIKFRIGKQKADTKVQWEGDCQFIHATLTEYINWMNSDNHCGLFAQYDNEIHWAYADYMYVKDLFGPILDYNVFNEIKWSNLGFAEEEGNDMAIWIGSKGAHTVCHYDTYGYNLVAQICGRKRWTLFPPTDTQSMYPTRLPYEESTVFSKVNVASPDISTFPRFTSSHPHIITLEPGDMLFVPTHWWHFVENLESSISVNAWFPSKCDSTQRINEAITRLLIGSSLCYQSTNLPPSTNQDTILSTGELSVSSWINPTETRMSNREENLTFLRNAMIAFNKNDLNDKALPRQNCPRPNEPCTCITEKTVPFEVNCIEVQQYCFKHACQSIDSWKSLHESIRDKRSKVTEELTLNKRRRTDKLDHRIESLTFKTILEVMTKPKVIDFIRNELEIDLLETK